jgi:hypothetical protein
MNKLNLKDVTLICIDDMKPQKSFEIMKGVCDRIDFGAAKLLSSKDSLGVTDKINPMFNVRDYNIFVIKEAHKYIDTDFCMFIQRDGYPLNTDMWTDDFLKYDYIGAPWTWAPPEHKNGICKVGKCVGNGGFSIRSKKLLQEIAPLEYNAKYPSGDLLQEDVFTCQFADEILKPRGITYAPVDLAHYFSVENKVYTGQFGFHGHETVKINQGMDIFKFKEHAYE